MKRKRLVSRPFRVKGMRVFKRRSTKPRKQRPKTRPPKRDTALVPKPWKLKKADTKFSEFIRNRDGKCMHPQGSERCKLLQNSHYIGRAVKSTRFDPDNCVTICWFHHYKSKDLGFEYQKQTKEKHGFDGQYTLWMRNHLGEERYNALIERSKESVKQNKAILAVMAFLDKT